MRRFSIKRSLLLSFCLVLSACVFLIVFYATNSRQKSIIQYQLEQEIQKYVGKSLTPMDGQCEDNYFMGGR